MAHRAPLSWAEKEYIRQQKANGASLREIAISLQCSHETARKWWRIQRKGKEIRCRGRPKRGALSTYPEALRLEAVNLKKRHPHWGPASVKLELKKESAFSACAMPSDARLSVLFRQICPEAVQVRHRQAAAAERCLEVLGPHQRWQVDGKEGISIGAEFATLLEIRELFCGLMIGNTAFITTNEKHWRHLTLNEVQSALRQSFRVWGQPLEIQTDHEALYWNVNDPSFPSLFTLWLVGLGIRHVTSRSHRPTDQGAVERNHRTLGDFSWKDETFSQVAEFQEAVNLHQQRYNTLFPSRAAHCHRQSPLTAFPNAITTGRPFHPDLEWEIFNLQRVDAYLAQFVWKRLITSNGVVYLAQKRYPLSRTCAGQPVSIRFIPEGRLFCFQDEAGNLLAEFPVHGLDKQDILGFTHPGLTLPLGFQFPLPLMGV